MALLNNCIPKLWITVDNFSRVIWYKEFMSATNRGTVRNKNDFYPTPGWCVDELIAELKPGCLKGKSFMEPCRGDGAIYSRVIQTLKPTLVDWCELSDGRDYLKTEPLHRLDAIITNPPFSLAKAFLEKSLAEADFVAYLLRINFLGSRCRHEFWQANLPSHLFALSRRPDFSGAGGDACEYAWFVWDRLNICKRQPGIHVIWNTKDRAYV